MKSPMEIFFIIGKFFKAPVIVASGITALSMVFVAMGFGFETPKGIFDEYKADHVAIHQGIDSTFGIIQENLKSMKDKQIADGVLIEALVRSECLRETKEHLSRAGLTITCRELGVEK